MVRPQRRPGEPDLPDGTRLLDRYTILARIGSGGMATIYRATDERLRRDVCVKLLRTTLVEGSGGTSGSRAVYQATYTHFLKEALALSRLSHPNTLRIYDFGYLGGDGEAQGQPFHVTEYLDGGNLESHVRAKGPLLAGEASGILDGICEAVAEAHEHGIIHRDIKPSNILFARVRGELVPKLADFGIAHSDVKRAPSHVDLGGAESISSVALFSPRWAAPEQLCGSPEGPRTDVYALGLLTIYMLGGTVLFDDEDVRLTFNDRVRDDELVRRRLHRLRLPAEVAAVITDAMLARREARIATAPEFAERMRAALKVRSSSHATALAQARENALQSTPTPAAELPVRYVHVQETLDYSFAALEGRQEVRFRVAMLPGPTLSLNVKGLSCFVAREGGRPTPAVSVSQDSVVSFVSSSREILGDLTLSFGQATPEGRVFVVNGQPRLVPYAEAEQAVMLTLSRGREIVLMCRT